LKAPIPNVQIFSDQEHITSITNHKNDIAQIIHAKEISVVQLDNNSLGKEIQHYPNIRINLEI
jgi:hypothetical protein